MNDNILCLYYSRTGNTKKAMEEVAEALDCECLEIRDKVDRSGTMGYLRCCFDAMHKRTSAVSRPKCQKPLSDYKLVILGTPVWAGRCASPVRALLKRRRRSRSAPIRRAITSGETSSSRPALTSLRRTRPDVGKAQTARAPL